MHYFKAYKMKRRRLKMATELKGAIELRKALRQFAPDLAKDTQKEIAGLLKPITAKARGFIPSNSPLSGWGMPTKGSWERLQWSASEAKRGISYRTSPSKPNRSGFRSLARIINTSAAGALYETAGRKNPQGRPQAKTREVVIPTFRRDTGAGEHRYTTSTNKNYGKSNNPNAGQQFVDALNSTGRIVDAYKREQGQAGRASRKMRGRAIFRAWAEDGGKTNAAVIKAIESSAAKLNARATVKR
jgi:hypothetical protein